MVDTSWAETLRMGVHLRRIAPPTDASYTSLARTVLKVL
jgi:hypothetical protein